MSLKEEAKKLKDQYYRPVPRIWRKVGDAMLLISSFVTGISAFTLPPIVTVIASGMGVIGKILTNFASE